jgi:hypothetical protein
MNKQFTFSIRKNGYLQRCSFTAPVESGYVITNNYCPNALIIGEGSMLSQIAIPQNGETENEFIQDCQNIVNKSNTISDDDVFFCLGQGLMNVVSNHINRCGRLLFQDLLIYMDCFAYLLKAAGYADSEIKRVYPIITKQIVDLTNQYIKDSHTLVPFQVTNIYKILCRLANQ